MDVPHIVRILSKDVIRPSVFPVPPVGDYRDGLVALSTYSPYTFDKGNSFTIFVISLPTYHSSALSEKSALDSYSILSPMFYEFH